VPKLGEVDQRQGCTFVLSPECLQQRLGLLEVGRVKALREPAVDRTLRTRLKRLVRKTIYFSKTTQRHDIVIGLFVNRYAFGRAV
jgi:hypothetical protein